MKFKPFAPTIIVSGLKNSIVWSSFGLNALIPLIWIFSIADIVQIFQYLLASILIFAVFSFPNLKTAYCPLQHIDFENSKIAGFYVILDRLFSIMKFIFRVPAIFKISLKAIS